MATPNHFFTTIDYDLLAEQKNHLLMVLAKNEAVGGTPVITAAEAEALEGILHLIDALQDTAEMIGLPVVFLTEGADHE